MTATARPTITVLARPGDPPGMLEIVLRAAPPGTIVRRRRWAEAVATDDVGDIAVACLDGIADPGSSCDQLRRRGARMVLALTAGAADPDDLGADDVFPLDAEQRFLRPRLHRLLGEAALATAI